MKDCISYVMLNVSPGLTIWFEQNVKKRLFIKDRKFIVEDIAILCLNMLLVELTIVSCVYWTQTLAKLPEAEKTYVSSLRIQKKHAEKDVAAVTTTLHNLASLNHQQGDEDEAERLYIKSLNLREQFIGHVNMEVASSMGSLAAVKVIASTVHRNVVCSDPLLEGHTELYHVISTDSRSKLMAKLFFVLQVAKHEYGEAERLYRKAIVILKEIVGEAHIAVAGMSTKLAVLLECHGAVEEAGELYVDALEVKERVR